MDAARVGRVVQALTSVLPAREVRVHHMEVLGTSWMAVTPTSTDEDAWPFALSVHANVGRAREVNLIEDSGDSGQMTWRREISEPLGEPPHWYWVMTKMYGDDVQLVWRSDEQAVNPRLAELDEALSRFLA
jgi:hypothetical protein